MVEAQTLSFSRETYAKLSPHPYLLAHLQPTSTSSSLRANGRQPSEFRDPHMNNGSLTHAEGSTVVRIGDTTVVCGIRGEILLASDVPTHRIDSSSFAPSSRSGYNEIRELDLLVPNVELATGCSPEFMPGQAPTALAQSLSTRISSLLLSSSLISGDDLRIWYQPPDLQVEDTISEDGASSNPPEVKAYWVLYIDVLFISLDGNPFDAAWAAVVSAMGDVRLPKATWNPDYEGIFCDGSVAESRKLVLSGLPIALTAVAFQSRNTEAGKGNAHWLLVDPDAFEDSLCEESVTVVIDCTDGEIRVLNMSKQGGTAIGKEEMAQVCLLAQSRWAQLNSLFKR